MKIHKCKQYSPEWWELRIGRATCSDFDKILTPGGKPSAQADTYIDELIGGILQPEANAFSESGRMGTADMQNGRDAEAEARKWYQVLMLEEVEEVGFIESDDPELGGSPDGLVGTIGGLELKCPKPKTHIGYIRKGPVLPNEYKPQVHGHLIVSGRTWWDFMSYCPPLPALLVRVVPDEYTRTLKASLEAFLVKYRAALKEFNVTPPWKAK